LSDSLDEKEPVVEEPPSPPEGLEWEKSRVKVAVNKVKAIQLAAPDSVVQEHGERVALSIDNDDGVVLRKRAGDQDDGLVRTIRSC